MLQVNVSQMLKGPVGETRIVAVDDDVALDGESLSRVSGEAKLTRTNRSILVQADLDTGVLVDCARCLERFTCPLHIRIEEEYFPTMDARSGITLPEPEEAEAFIIDEGLTLDLTDAIRQYLLLAIPMKPLCQPDCPGIKV
jgi:uncharacterized protein